MYDHRVDDAGSCGADCVLNTLPLWGEESDFSLFIATSIR